MENRVYWKNYQDKKVLICDYRNLTKEEHLNSLHVHFEEVKKIKERGEEEFCVLMFFSGMKMGAEVSNYAKKIQAYLEKNNIKQKMSVVGIDGLTRLISKLLKPDIMFAASEEEAIDWLLK